MSITECREDDCSRWSECDLFAYVQSNHSLEPSTWFLMTFGHIVTSEYKYNSSWPTTSCFNTLMGSDILLGFGSMCQKKDTRCQFWTAFDTKTKVKWSRNHALECHEKNVKDCLVCFLFGFGGMCENTDARCQLWTTFDMKTKAKWSERELSGDNKYMLIGLGC